MPERVVLPFKCGDFRRGVKKVAIPSAGNAASALAVEATPGTVIDRTNVDQYVDLLGPAAKWGMAALIVLGLGYGVGRCGIAPCPGHTAGEFAFGHTAATDSHGNVFVGETITGRRVQKFVRVGGGQ